jgi:hypothetical protein
MEAVVACAEEAPISPPSSVNAARVLLRVDMFMIDS